MEIPTSIQIKICKEEIKKLRFILKIKREYLKKLQVKP